MGSDKLMNEVFYLFKSSTDATWGTISMLQNQTERMVDLLLDQYANLQTESRKQLEEWVSNTKQNQEELKKAYNEGMDKLTELMAKK